MVLLHGPVSSDAERRRSCDFSLTHEREYLGPFILYSLNYSKQMLNNDDGDDDDDVYV